MAAAPLALLAAAGFEAPPTFQAAQLLPAAQVKGPHHTIEAGVPLRGLHRQYTIKSDYGAVRRRRRPAAAHAAQGGGRAGAAGGDERGGGRAEGGGRHPGHGGQRGCPCRRQPGRDGRGHPRRSGEDVRPRRPQGQAHRREGSGGGQVFRLRRQVVRGGVDGLGGGGRHRLGGQERPGDQRGTAALGEGAGRGPLHEQPRPGAGAGQGGPDRRRRALHDQAGAGGGGPFRRGHRQRHGLRQEPGRAAEAHRGAPEGHGRLRRAQQGPPVEQAHPARSAGADRDRSRRPERRGRPLRLHRAGGRDRLRDRRLLLRGRSGDAGALPPHPGAAGSPRGRQARRPSR